MNRALTAAFAILLAAPAPAFAQQPPTEAEPPPAAAEPAAAEPAAAEPAAAEPVAAEPVAAPAPAPAPAATKDGDRKVPDIIRGSQEEYAQGTCATPYEAMIQLLYWVQEGTRVDKAKAAACMDASAVSNPKKLGELAFKLKKTFDVRGLYIDVDAIPKNPEFTNADGFRRWRVPDLEGVEIVKQDDKWVFSAATVRRIDSLYADTIPPTLERLLDALPDWMHDRIGPTKIWQLVGVLLLVLIALTLQKTVVYLVSTYVRRLGGKLAVKWIDTAADRIGRPIGGLAMAGVFYLGFPWLQFSVRVSQAARVATQVLAVFSVVWLGYRLIDVLCDWLGEKAGGTETKLDDQLVPMLRKVLKVFAVVIGGIFILQNLNVNVGSLLAGLGLGGLAFALAAKDSIANIFGSLVIFIDKPFQIGDWIIIGGVEGIVEEVGFRTTRVRTFYNSLVTVPNAQMTNASIDNYGLRRWRRYKTTLGLTYDTPPEKIQAFCEGVRAIIKGLDGMRKDYYLVEFYGFGDFSLNVFVYCFTDSPDWSHELRTRTILNLEIVRLAEKLGVQFAFPTRTLHVETQARESDIPTPEALSPEELAMVVNGFGPRGELARPKGIELTYGYDPGSAPQRGSDGE